ncbi:MAG: SCO family protein [Bryobacteraceae bacterium]|nr:SCO family protein [Bryobacteraceae bacterium]
MKRLFLLLLLTSCHRTPELPVLYDVPAFTLTAENGQAFSSESLKGQVWIADFIFTHCPGPCLRMSTQMKKLQSQARLVSFTVDPARDTPEVLAAYGRRYQADPARWTFLTGPKEQLNVLSRNVFKVGDIEADLTHSTRMILVDREMRIRGFYDSADADDLAKLRAALPSL